MKISIPFVWGLAFMLLGVGGYWGTGSTSVTALIPAVFGLALWALCAGSRGGRLGTIATYGVGTVALFGVLGALRAVPDLLAWAGGGTMSMSLAAVATQGVLLVLAAALLLVWIASVVQRRRQPLA